MEAVREDYMLAVCRFAVAHSKVVSLLVKCQKGFTVSEDEKSHVFAKSYQCAEDLAHCQEKCGYNIGTGYLNETMHFEMHGEKFTVCKGGFLEGSLDAASELAVEWVNEFEVENGTENKQNSFKYELGTIIHYLVRERRKNEI